MHEQKPQRLNKSLKMEDPRQESSMIAIHVRSMGLHHPYEAASIASFYLLLDMSYDILGYHQSPFII